MEIGAIAIAATGFFVGLFFRLKALFPIVGLVLLISIILAVTSHFTFLQTAYTVLISQTILQGSYFVGLTVRTLFNGPRGGSHVF